MDAQQFIIDLLFYINLTLMSTAAEAKMQSYREI